MMEEYTEYKGKLPVLLEKLQAMKLCFKINFKFINKKQNY